MLMCVDVYGVMGGIDGGLLVVGVINDVRYGSVNVCGCKWCNGGEIWGLVSSGGN